MAPSHLETEFQDYWATIARSLSITPPAPVAEYHFAEDIGRHWRFDFAWAASRVAVEMEGGTFSHGRHTRPIGFENDCTKYNYATLTGWRVFRFTAKVWREAPYQCVALVLVALGVLHEDRTRLFP